MFFRLRLKTLSLVALSIITFATIAPFLASVISPTSAKSFVQEICSKNGERFLLNVVTTKGNSISTLIDVKDEKKHTSLTHQFDHCPFCAFGTEHMAITAINFPYIHFQKVQSNFLLTQRNLARPKLSFYSPHPTRAPPLA
ncbi:MAG: DUF2946 family protein [Methylophilus sp.]|nr:DUF2946 family protein [Methylophilus sp.]